MSFKIPSIFFAVLLSTSVAYSQGSFRRADLTSNAANPVESKGGPTSVPAPNPDIKRLYKQAVKYADAGLYRQAAETFQLALNMAPTYADAYYGLGQAYYEQRHWQKAINSLERALQLDPKQQNSRDLLNQARLNLEKQRNAPATVPPQVEGERVAMKTEVSSTSPAPTITKSNISANELKLTKIYRVGPNDVLDIRLNNSSSPQSTLFTVTPSGFLEYPVLVEPVPVHGLMVEEIAAKIEAELTRRALADKPKVQVGVRDYASHTILISGLVKDSGTKILRREAVPLYVVLADAQPLPEASNATIIRNDSNETFEINLASPTDMNMLVRPGDVITLQPNDEQFLYVGGAVKSPGERVYRRGLTLMQVILAAGGVSPKAKEVRLGRDDGKGFLVTNRYKLKDIDAGKERDPLVRPGDRIMVVE
jgi:protein involved in polysaccharide export with SLBB domain